MDSSILTAGTKLRSSRRERREEKERVYKLLQKLDCSFIYPDSPIELLEADVSYEINSYKYYACLVMQNTGEKRIKSVDIRFLCYQYANIPYAKIPFTYSYDKNTFGERITKEDEKQKQRRKKRGREKYIAHGEVFGSKAYIRLPDSYFKRIELELRSVTFEDGSTIILKTAEKTRARSYSELDDIKRYAFSHINIYKALEEQFPTKNFPAATENAWICCCGQKNIKTDAFCSRCARNFEWQLENINETAFSCQIEKENDAFSPELKNYKKAVYYSTKQAYVNEAEQKRKQELTKIALENVRKQQEEEERIRLSILPRVLGYFILFGVLITIFTFIMNIR